MHSQLLPTVLLPPGYEDGSGGGLVAERRDDFSERINLDLGIGSYEGSLKWNNQEKKESLFTVGQFDEFYNQILVYNSIIFGLPVAFHLLLPIWMSVFNSLGPAIYNKYPSFLGFGPHNSSHSSVMDPEPGRCRRTDGRKWRCSKNVVPRQKYCERHMHRGRQGSRKHVEPIQRRDKITSDDNKTPIMSFARSDVDDRITKSIQGDHSTEPSCSNHRSKIQETLKCKGDGDREALFTKTTVDNKVNKIINVDYGTSTSSNSKNLCTTNEVNHAEGKSSSDNANPRKIGSLKQNVARNNHVGFISPRFGLSPKSVLHCATDKVSSGLSHKTVIETEPQRCRRTDGKKWQCRRDALPHQKYCEAHMHRGAKKLMLNPQSVSNSLATSSAEWDHTSRAKTRNVDSGINLNTVPASPEHTMGNNSTSSTSDATTITDEIVSYCQTHPIRFC